MAELDSAKELDSCLRSHHKHVVNGTVDLQQMPAISAQVFACLCTEAKTLLDSDLTAPMAELFVLRHKTLHDCLGSHLASKLCETGSFSGSPTLQQSLTSAYCKSMSEILGVPEVLSSIVADLAKAWIADPACQGLFQPMFFFKGFQALTTHRVAHQLWMRGGAANVGAALLLQSRMAELFAVDIHPAAQVGAGVMLDHASGIVIGSTAIIGNDVYMLHSTTLGATGKPMGEKRRHPKIGSSTTIGAGCTVLGDVDIGDKATIGAAAVVTRNVPPGGTVVGVNNLLKRKLPASRQASTSTPPKPSIREQFEMRCERLEADRSDGEEAADEDRHTDKKQKAAAAPAPATTTTREESEESDDADYVWYYEPSRLASNFQAVVREEGEYELF